MADYSSSVSLASSPDYHHESWPPTDASEEDESISDGEHDHESLDHQHHHGSDGSEGGRSTQHSDHSETESEEEELFVRDHPASSPPGPLIPWDSASASRQSSLDDYDVEEDEEVDEEEDHDDDEEEEEEEENNHDHGHIDPASYLAQRDRALNAEIHSALANALHSRLGQALAAEAYRIDSNGEEEEDEDYEDDYDEEEDDAEEDSEDSEEDEPVQDRPPLHFDPDFFDGHGFFDFFDGLRRNLQILDDFGIDDDDYFDGVDDNFDDIDDEFDPEDLDLEVPNLSNLQPRVDEQQRSAQSQSQSQSQSQQQQQQHRQHRPQHHFFPPLQALHPDRYSPLVRGVNPLSFITPHLHDHSRLASSSPASQAPNRDRMDRSSRLRSAGQAQQRDELISVEVENADAGGRAQRASRGRDSVRSENPSAHAQPDVIDLTGDDGDEVVVSASQNARRQQSSRRSTAPRLSRSDSSYIGSQTPQNVIDISSDSEDDDDEVQIHGVRPQSIPANPRPHHHHHHHAPHHHHHHHHHHRPLHNPHRPGLDGRSPRHLPAVNLGNGPNNRASAGAGPFARFFNFVGFGSAFANQPRDEDIVMLGARASPAAAVPIPGLAPIHLNYIAHPFGDHVHHIPPPPPAAAQKPPHEPPPKARDGFTRDTGEEQIVICPSCDEELAYNPDESDENGPPAKKPRTRKDKAEHHFWAVKDCGHVYCKKCFDHRRPTGKNPVRVGFKPAPENAKKILCAVDGCVTDVSNKTAWVGIFL
ncbi:hypothetical protein BX600DRAFT_515971 [Xylariales sp. PMI_506]|nr:hypothetical protein BX600DRAFT_515971 [Xylariales sp. PMI_506]